MSTEHQQYSIQNQAAAIQRYAEFNGFEIVRTYADPARSGVVLRGRTGLQQLLQDVLAGAAAFRAILVHDVSRWGRFQDTDEAAHYEFICKSAGIPVHYCSETFANDGTLPNLIMKALKRTMAGEYSRELGARVSAGLRRITALGFKAGGSPGYGLRRILVGQDKVAKCTLRKGQKKSFQTDRVILAPGPAHEVRIVRDIYRMLISDGRSVKAISRELNRRGVKFPTGTPWDYQAVFDVLTSVKYIGCYVFGKTSCKLYTPLQRVPKSEWIVVPGAFKPIVDYPTFAQAQHILYQRSVNRSNEELLDALRTLLRRKGRLSYAVITEAEDVPCTCTYRHRFGSLQRAYELIGYGHSENFGPTGIASSSTSVSERARCTTFRIIS
jgi:DNA invertase Pin-like site-specific DNA recombinase